MQDITSIFIKKSKKIHGNKYSYNLVIYKNCKIKVNIICRQHGIFAQSPSKHLIGQGCPKCSKFRKKSCHEFKEKARLIHSDKYDYSKTDFNHILNKTIIICPLHGEFSQTLDKHINLSRGCPVCGGSKKKTQQEFLDNAKKVHGTLYDYSLSKYINFEKKIIIICKKHGKFLQTPHNHIIGKQGCPRCGHRISKLETRWLNYIGLPNDPQHRNVLVRLNNRKIKADGYEPTTNTIYEFNGDYYHGHPLFYAADKVNPHTKCTFGELYNRTLSKEKAIINAGFNLVSIWEHEWNIVNEAI